MGADSGAEERINELKRARGNLKRGEYDGVDIMTAWLAIDELVEHLEATTTAQAVPDGWKLVPIDSKHIDLFSPAFNLCSEFGQEFVQANEAFARAVYREFVAAAPAMPEGKK